MAKFFFSKSRLGHPKNSTKLKFEKRSSRKHGPKFQFQVRNSWRIYLNIYYDRDISCLTKSCNFASGHPLDMVLVSILRFLSMGIHLEPFLEASDRPEGQELGVGAVGGQEVLQGVKF